MDVCLLWVLCVVRKKDSETGWSLVQRSSTDCGVSKVCDRETSTKRGGPGPYRAVEPYKKKFQRVILGKKNVTSKNSNHNHQAVLFKLKKLTRIPRNSPMCAYSNAVMSFSVRHQNVPRNGNRKI
jgi:hypothetical protein